MDDGCEVHCGVNVHTIGREVVCCRGRLPAGFAKAGPGSDALAG